MVVPRRKIKSGAMGSDQVWEEEQGNCGLNSRRMLASSERWHVCVGLNDKGDQATGIYRSWEGPGSDKVGAKALR